MTTTRPSGALRLARFSVLFALATLALGDASANTPSESESVERGMVWPPRIKRREADAPPESADARMSSAIDEDDPNRPAIEPPGGQDADPEEERPKVDADAPAEEPADGIWAWVDRMEGEIPTEEQLQAIQESGDVELAELALIDELSGGDVPVEFYRDPRGVMAVHPLFLDQVDPNEFDIPVVVNPEVEKWVKYFTGSGRKYYAKWLSRSTRYRPMMYRALEKAGLPSDLVYLSMIESGYNAHAYSHAAAAGLWQFIPSTARLYKMRVDFWVDDRRDPETSVQAAIAFLSELHRMFGKWELAWAAYNGGPGRIRRATEQAGSKDFWVLARGSYLHPETDNYVPKIMAAAIIGKHPERYGFTDIAFEPELTYDTARVEGSVSLEIMAKCAGTSTEELKALNPALRRFATPPEGYDVRLPSGTRDRFLVALAAVPEEKRVIAQSVARHTVRKGETLSGIAAKYQVSLSELSRANGLKNANRITVGMSLVVPVKGEYPETDTRVAAVSTPRRTDAAPSRTTTHRVQRGDTLSGIASRYGVTVEQIKAANGLKNSTIMVGQTLKLQSSGGASSSSPVSRTYTVQRGDTLSTIASRHKVSTSDLQRWNGIDNPSRITVGQTLKIQGGGSSASGASGFTTYTVKSGDSLGRIASRHGCTVQQLQQWNGLKTTVIQPGQKLKIRSG